MLNVADVVEDEVLDAAEQTQIPTQVPTELGSQQTLEQRRNRAEESRAALSHQLMAQSRHDVCIIGGADSSHMLPISTATQCVLTFEFVQHTTVTNSC